ncbi:helix-turn-helix transcriptional regulator [Mycoplasmatota bacterium WC44]
MKLYINENIRYLRLKNNITQKELSSKVTTTYRGIISYERKERVPRIEHIVELAAFFNVTLDDIVLKDLSKE